MTEKKTDNPELQIKQINLNLPVWMIRQVNVSAAEMGVTFDQLIICILANSLKKPII